MTITLPTQPNPTTHTTAPTAETGLRVGVLTTSPDLHALLSRRCTAAGHPPVVHATPRVHRSASNPGTDAQRLDAIRRRIKAIPLVAAHARELGDRLRPWELDVLVAYGYPTLLPPDALGAARIGVLNLHTSRLPDLRGAAPVPAAILRGDRDLWGTAHLMDETYDTGRVVVQEHLLELPPWCTYDEMNGKVTDALLALVPRALILLARGCTGTPQDEALATRAVLPSDADLATIDLARTTDRVAARMRAAHWIGWRPVAIVDGRPCHLGRPHTRSAPDRTPIRCADGLLWVDECTPISDAAREPGTESESRP